MLLFEGIWLEIKVLEADILRLFSIEIIGDRAVDFAIKAGDALGAVFDLDEGNDVSDFGFGADAVAVFLANTAGKDGGSTLVIAEGVGEGFVTAAEDPVNDFAFVHDVEVVDIEVATIDHRLSNVGEELHVSTGFFAVVDGGEGEILGGKVGGDFWGAEGDFVEVLFVLDDSKVLIETGDLVESPDVVMEVAVHEGVFETIGREIRKVVIGDGIEVVIGDFAGEDAVFFEKFHDGARIADDLSSAFLGRFLGFGIAIHKINTMLEGWRSDIVEEASEGLFFIMSKMPDD